MNLRHAVFGSGSDISPEDQAQLATFADALDTAGGQARAYSRKVRSPTLWNCIAGNCIACCRCELARRRR